MSSASRFPTIQAYTFVALRPVLTRRTPRYASVAQASERLGLQLECKRYKDLGGVTVYIPKPFWPPKVTIRPID